MAPAVAATAGEIILPIHMGEAPAAETMAEAAAAAAIKAATAAVIRPWAIIAAATTIAETTATAAVARRTAAGTAMIIIPIPEPQDSRRYPVRKPVAVTRNKPIPGKRFWVMPDPGFAGNGETGRHGPSKNMSKIIIRKIK